MKRIIELSHATLEPGLLFGATDAVATAGKIHAQATRAAVHEGERFALADAGVTPDLLLGNPKLAARARELFRDIAQEIANSSGTAVEYRVNGETVTVEPATR